MAQASGAAQLWKELELIAEVHASLAMAVSQSKGIGECNDGSRDLLGSGDGAEAGG